MDAQNVNQKTSFPVNSVVEFKSDYKPSMFTWYTGYKIARISREELVVEQKYTSGMFLRNEKTQTLTVYFPIAASKEQIRRAIFLRRYKVSIQYLSDTSLAHINTGSTQSYNAVNPTTSRKSGSIYFKDAAEADKAYALMNTIISELRQPDPSRPAQAQQFNNNQQNPFIAQNQFGQQGQFQQPIQQPQPVQPISQPTNNGNNFQ